VDQFREDGVFSFRCGFCGFVYQEIEKAEACELRCITGALNLLDQHASEVTNQLRSKHRRCR